MPDKLIELQDYFFKIEQRIDALLLENKKLYYENQQLLTAYTDLEKKYEAEKRKYQILAEQEKETKLHAALAGNPEHNRLMRHHINRLIKEVDFCITELKNTGL